MLPAIETVAVSFVNVLSCFQFAKVPLFFDIRKKISFYLFRRGLRQSLSTLFPLLRFSQSVSFVVDASLYFFNVFYYFLGRYPLPERTSSGYRADNERIYKGGRKVKNGGMNHEKSVFFEIF